MGTPAESWPLQPISCDDHPGRGGLGACQRELGVREPRGEQPPTFAEHQRGDRQQVLIDQARAAMHKLHNLRVQAGPCVAAALAGVREVLGDTDRRAALTLAADSVLVLINTEGAV
jgi:hypothetical protein